MNEQLRQSIDRAKEVKAQRLVESVAAVDRAARDLEHAKYVQSWWESATPHDVTTLTESENSDEKRLAEAIKSRERRDRDANALAERQLVARGSTHASMTLFVVTLLAHGISPFFLSEYETKLLMSGFWLCFLISLSFCWS